LHKSHTHEEISIARNCLPLAYFYRPFEDLDRILPRCSFARRVDPAMSCVEFSVQPGKPPLYPCAPESLPNPNNPKDIFLSSLWAQWDRNHYNPCRPRKLMERYLAGLFSDLLLIHGEQKGRLYQ